MCQRGDDSPQRTARGGLRNGGLHVVVANKVGLYHVTIRIEPPRDELVDQDLGLTTVCGHNIVLAVIQEVVEKAPTESTVACCQ